MSFAQFAIRYFFWPPYAWREGEFRRQKSRAVSYFLKETIFLVSVTAALSAGADGDWLTTWTVHTLVWASLNLIEIRATYQQKIKSELPPANVTQDRTPLWQKPGL